MAAEGITAPRHPHLWERAFTTKPGVNHTHGVRLVYNNFEVTKVDFFLRDEVWTFTEAVYRSQGIFKYRWGDAVLRYLTLALFAKPEEVLWRMTDFKDMRYCHSHHCS